MKKIAILLVIGVALSTGAKAQTKDVKTDQRVLTNSIKDKKEDKHEAGKDMAHLRIKSAMRERREIRRHRRSIRKQGEHLENHGVSHPIQKSKRQLKADKDAKNGRD
jgi:hypothetical protein